MDEKLRELKNATIFNYIEDLSNVNFFIRENTKIIKFKEMSDISISIENNKDDILIRRVRRIEICYKSIIFINSSGHNIFYMECFDGETFINIYNRDLINTYFIEIKTKNKTELNSSRELLDRLYPKFRYNIYPIASKDNKIMYKIDVHVKTYINGEEFILLTNEYDNKESCMINYIKLSDKLEICEILRRILVSMGENNGTYLLFNNNKYKLMYMIQNTICLEHECEYGVNFRIEEFIDNKNILLYNNDDILYIDNQLYNKNINITGYVSEILLHYLNDNIIKQILEDYSIIYNTYRKFKDPSIIDNIENLLSTINEILNSNIFDSELLNSKSIIMMPNNIKISKEIFITLKQNLMRYEYLIDEAEEFAGIEMEEESDNCDL